MIIIVLSLLLTTCLQAVVQEGENPPLGHPLFHPVYAQTALDGGRIFTLNPLQRNYLNIENSLDLLSGNIRFYQPDLVTDGQELATSSSGSGLSAVKLYWRDRPQRNPRSGRADFNRIPAHFVGGVRSVGTGAIAGAAAAGGVIQFQPVSYDGFEPVTALHHRMGFYSYAPVDVVHSRALRERLHLTIGGYFPSSPGRFENSTHSGSQFYGELSSGIGAEGRLTFSYMTQIDNTGITYSDRFRKYWDNDFDISFENSLGKDSRIKFFGYKTYRVEKESAFRNYAREYGAGFRLTGSAGGQKSPGFTADSTVAKAEVPDTSSSTSVAAGGSTKEPAESEVEEPGRLHIDYGIYLRGSGLDIDFKEPNRVRLTELEGSAAIRGRYKPLSLSLLAGASGWYPDRVKPVVVPGMELDLNPLGTVYGIYQLSSDPHTPEEMFANYRTSRPSFVFEPIWKLRDDLPVKGAVLPVTAISKWEAGICRKWHEFAFDVSFFQRNVSNPIHWTVEGDSVLIPQTAHDRSTSGWVIDIGWTRSQYRASVSMLRLLLDDFGGGLERGVPVQLAEPEFRLGWEIGWRDVFWNGVFESDVSLSGKYYNLFYTYTGSGWAEVGGAYPLDLKLSFRISRFTLYYALHNLNSYQYELVPGYRMMHKEEYWGVHWLLLD